MPAADVEHAGLGGRRWLAGRIPRLPVEAPPVPINYSPALVAYVGVLAAGAVAAAVATVRLPADSALLAMGACATFLLAATAVKVLSGAGSFWSASIFAHLGLSLAAGPIGALVAVAGEVTGTNARFGVSWFKSVFNGSNQFLSNLAAWEVFHAMTGGGTSLGPGLLGGLTAGLVCWLVNIWLLAVVQRLTQPDLRMLRYVGQNAGAVLLYHLGAGVTAFGGIVLVGREGADGFLLLLVPVLLLQISLLVLASRTQAAQLQREAHARERELLLRRALEASDAERHRIARNLHDGVVQDLATIALGLRSRAERGDETDSTAMLHAADATAEAIEELRTLLREIAPPDLQEIGLAAALDELAEPLRDQGVEVRIGLTPAAREVRGTVLAAAYRITQEALRNVTQHASAHHVRVSVRSDESHLELEIADDGVGFSAESRHRQAEAGHLGLSLIHDLARESGGQLEIHSAPRAGTALRARLPLDGASAARTPGGGQPPS
ncbi:MAG: sensor histidine kinase [Candidatus Dormibacteria bacterium]|jgi:signal transduction histidine kinase